jgi:ubiquinone/menaquinone biosynthesis C-methylase UbiE
MTTQYAKIAEGYSKNEGQDIVRKYMYESTFFDVIGSLEGLNVVDYACGTGAITRQLKQRGAKQVIGVDAEQKMLDYAIEEERKNPLGIDYLCHKVGNMPFIGEFDLATPFFLLHYAKTKNELERMCQDIYDNLAVNGRMVGINEHSDHPLTNQIQYGATVASKGPLKEGCKMDLRLYKNGKLEMPPIEFTHWNKKTYETALHEAGFKEVVWHPIRVSSEGIEKLGEDYWKDWFKEEYLTIIEARK